MSYAYLAMDDVLVFQAPDAQVTPVLMNPRKQKFCLIARPELGEISALIEEHARLRMEAHWNSLLSVSPRATRENQIIQAFRVIGGGITWIPRNVLKQAAGATTKVGVQAKLSNVSVETQQTLLQSYKPNNIQEMLAFYRDMPTEDVTGYRYFMSLLEDSKDALTFFGQLIDNIFLPLADINYRKGTAPTQVHQARTFELLGMALAKQWLLFPFVHHSSGLQEHYIISHAANTVRFFSEPYRPAEIGAMMTALEAVPVEKTTHARFAQHFRNLVISSTFRDIQQSSHGFFETCTRLMAETERPMMVQNLTMARRTYNALIKVYNSQAQKGYTIKELTVPRAKATLADFSSFQHLRDIDPKWEAWASAFESFIAATPDTQGKARRLACNEFADFLVELTNPPLAPELTPRNLINDYNDDSLTYRNVLKTSDNGYEARNARLGNLSAFFDYARDKLRTESKQQELESSWFPNPVDLRFDRFVEKYRAGSHRKALPSHIMELMRNILVADDYAWPKTALLSDWSPLVNNDTGSIERIWCPSATTLLYSLLSIPLRSLQGRLLDSGEGDAEIFDFDQGRMVPNPHQLPVNGRLDPRRKQGLLQTMPSGMRGISDILGLWISTNKTSDQGYAIPWVSDDLIRHLRYQYEFIQRYAPNPHMHCISEAQGHRNTPEEWVEREHKFYCLFRDPSSERTTDPSLPVSKQKLLKLWGLLCVETQRRHNEATAIGERITLARPGTENDTTPKALFDIHSLRVSGITDLLDRGVPLNIVSEYVAGHATYIMTLWYDKPAPGAVRNYLLKARELVGDKAGPLPQFSQDELDELSPFLLPHPDHKELYNGFDALTDNKGLILFRQAGICPGTQCSEGGLDEVQRAIPVPIGDRGPSCPQCRFFLTGPAFLLGQAIEGNQLILKIRNKIQGLAELRDRVMDADDSEDIRKADLLRGQAEIEERQLNDMLTEWWHRMRFYEASVSKLQAYQEAQKANTVADKDKKGHHVVLLSKSTEEDIQYSFNQATNLELKHFLSTCAEILPEFSLEPTGARRDIELAVGRFLSMNDERDLTSLFFKLTEEQRHTAANLAVELMLQAATPEQTSDLLEGKLELSALPELQQDITRMLSRSQSKAFTLPKQGGVIQGETK